jgi:branched-subunit amino acid ABC-type transport system permease component
VADGRRVCNASVVYLLETIPIREIFIGLSIGSRLFLIALGLSLIFGVLGVLNFAHGALYMIGAFIGMSFTTELVGNFWIGLLAAGLTVGLIGVVIESGFIRRIYDRPKLDQLILTFAFIFVINELVLLTWGTGTKTTPTPQLLDFDVALLGASFTAYRVFLILLSGTVMITLWLVLQRTFVGRVVRATSTDRDMSALLGVNVPRVYTGVFFVGSALTGIGGALAAPIQGITPGIGNQVIIQAFIIVVIGGLGSFVGAFAGAMIIGLINSFGVLVIAGGDVFLPFLVMLLVLIFRPTGLFGGGS